MSSTLNENEGKTSLMDADDGGERRGKGNLPITSISLPSRSQGIKVRAGARPTPEAVHSSLLTLYLAIQLLLLFAPINLS
jgi:hypothetical protein